MMFPPAATWTRAVGLRGLVSLFNRLFMGNILLILIRGLLAPLKIPFKILL